MFWGKCPGEHAGGATFFGHVWVAAGLGYVVRQAAVMRSQLVKLLFKGVILVKQLSGFCCGFKGVRGRGGEEFSYVFPVFEGGGKGGGKVV